MAQTIKLKRSSVAGNIPGSSDLSLGEIAVNTADGAVYIKKGNNDIVAVADNDILHIDTTNSRIGIGTTSPSFPLHTKTTGNTVAKFETSLTSDLAIQLTNSQGSMFFGLGGGEEFAIGTNSDLNGSGNLFTIKQDGKVGIGTTSPQTLLHISGANPEIRLSDTSNTNYNGIKNIDGNMIYMADSGSQMGNSRHRWEIDGSEKMRLHMNGYLGIGTTSPSEKLHVIGGAFLGSTTHASDSRVTINGSVGGISNALTVKNSSASTSGRGTRINLASSNTEIGRIEARTVTDSTSGSLSLSTASSGSMSTAMFIDSSQRVGIGTTSPSEKLEVNGNVKFGNSVTGLSLVHSTDEYRINGVDVGGNAWNSLHLKADGNDGLFIQKDTNKVGIGTTSPNSLLHVSHATAPTFRLSRTGTGQVWIQSIDSSGRFQLAEAASEGGTQYARLQVDDTGEITFNGAYTFPTADGSANQVLQTDGSGNLTFEDVSGSSGITVSNNANNRVLTGDGTNANAEANLTFDGSNLDLPDNIKARFGTGSDLQIYHDGNHSYIHDSGPGNLKVRTNSLNLMNAANNEIMIGANENGAVTLYYNNSQKLATVTGGVNITGQLTADGLSTSSGTALVGEGASGGSTQLIYWNGTNAYYGRNNLGGSVTAHEFRSGGTTRLTVNSTGIDVTGTISSGHLTVNTSTFKTTNNAIGLFTTDLTVGNNVAQQSTATPKRIFFNNDYSSGYTDASLKLYLFNDSSTRQGFTSGPAYDLQYHTSGSSSGRHAFYVANVEEARIDAGGIDIRNGGLDINGTTVIDSSRNLTNIGTISSGNISVGAVNSSQTITTSNAAGFVITNQGKLYSNSNNLYLETFTNGTGIVLNSRTGYLTFKNNGTNKFQITSSNNFNFYSGNLTNVGTISSGAITSTGLTLSGSNDEILNLNSTDDGAVYMAFKRSSDRHAYLGFGGSSDAFSIMNEETGGSLQFGTAGSTRLTISNTGTASFTGSVIASDYLQHYSYLYSRNNLRVLNTAGDGWNTWATRSNGTFNLDVGTLEATSFSDGTISGITFIDEDSFSTNSATRIPTQQSIKAYVDAQVAGVVDSAPSALNTLNELADALGDDANFSTTTSTALGNRLRVDTASQGLTGTQQANAITNLGITATKAELNHVDGVTSSIQGQLNTKLNSSSAAVTNKLPKAGGTMTGDITMGANQVDFNAGGGNSTSAQIIGDRSTTDLNSRLFSTEGGLSYTTYDSSTSNIPSGTTNNANGVLTINTHGGTYNHQLAFTNNKGFWHRHKNASTLTSWDRVFTDNYHPNADTLTTARTIGGVSFNGSANINLPGVNTAGNQNTSGTAAGLSGTPNISVGTISSGAITSSGNLHAGDGTNISMDASANGQLEIEGNGYQGAITLDGSAMHLYHNSSSRDLILGTNETARLTISSGGTFNFNSNNLQSIGTISSGAITATGLTTLTNVKSLTDLFLSRNDGTSPAVVIPYFDRFRFITDSTGNYNEAQLGVNPSDVLYTNNGYAINTTTVIDSNRNLTNIGTISSGKITVTSSSFNDHIALVRGAANMGLSPSGNELLVIGGGFAPDSNNSVSLGRSDKIWLNVFAYNYKIGGTTVINSSRDLSNIRNYSGSGTITINQGSSFSKLDIKTSRTGATENIGGVQFYNNSDIQKSQLYGTNDGKLKLATNGTTVALTLDASQNATFAGNVVCTGSLSAATKSFDIEHPSKKGMRLHHGVVEGPEHSVYVRGKSKEKVILLPDYWVDLVHEDTITVQLTAIGNGQDLYVEDIKDNKVYVNGDNYFYYIQAERKDVERFEVEYGNSL